MCIHIYVCMYVCILNRNTESSLVFYFVYYIYIFYKCARDVYKIYIYYICRDTEKQIGKQTDRQKSLCIRQKRRVPKKKKQKVANTKSFFCSISLLESRSWQFRTSSQKLVVRGLLKSNSLKAKAPGALTRMPYRNSRLVALQFANLSVIW